MDGIRPLKWCSISPLLQPYDSCMGGPLVAHVWVACRPLDSSCWGNSGNGLAHGLPKCTWLAMLENRMLNKSALLIVSAGPPYSGADYFWIVVAEEQTAVKGPCLHILLVSFPLVHLVGHCGKQDMTFLPNPTELHFCSYIPKPQGTVQSVDMLVLLHLSCQETNSHQLHCNVLSKSSRYISPCQWIVFID